MTQARGAPINNIVARHSFSYCPSGTITHGFAKYASAKMLPDSEFRAERWNNPSLSTPRHHPKPE